MTGQPLGCASRPRITSKRGPNASSPPTHRIYVAHPQPSYNTPAERAAPAALTRALPSVALKGRLVGRRMPQTIMLRTAPSKPKSGSPCDPRSLSPLRRSCLRSWASRLRGEAAPRTR